MMSLVFLVACSGGPPGGPGGGGGDRGQQQEEPDRRLLVEAEEVVRGSVADHLETTGTIDSEFQADIVPETSGTVTRVDVEEGDEVRRGQVLAVIANPTLDASNSRAQIELQRAQNDLDRARQLHSDGAISDLELTTAETAFANARTSANEASRTRGFTRITSPIAGTVAVRDVRLGELAGGTRAFQVVDLSQLRVIVQLPEKDLARVKLDQDVVLSSAYDPDARASGTVTRISPVVDAATGTVRVTIAIEPGQSVLRPGQFVKTRVEVSRHDDVITIPRRALVWEDGEPIAWAVEDAPEEEEEEGEGEGEGEEAAEEEGGFFASLFGGSDEAEEQVEEGADEAAEEDDGPPIPQRVAVRKALTVGFMDADHVEVTEGLTEGEQVIVVGNANLRDGASVRLPDDPVPELANEDEEDDGEDSTENGEG